MNLLKRLLMVAFIFSCPSFALAADAQAADITVTNAFFYVPLGSSKTTAAFFTITNHSNKEVRIASVLTESAKQIVVVPGPVIEVPAHQSLSLRPGGPYLQINGLKGRISTGDELHLVVNLSSGRKIYLVAHAKSAYDQVHGH